MSNCNLDTDFLLDILERQNNLIVRVDSQNRFLYISQAYADFFGLEKNEMLGKVFIPPICEEDVVAFQNIHNTIKQTKTAATIIQRELTQNGWAWFEWNITPILDENGEIKEIQSVGQDVTSLISTKDTLNLIFQALEQSSAAVLITDTDGKIIYANQKFKQLYKYEDEDLIGENPRILKSGLTNETIFDEMWQSILRGEEFNCELTNKTKDGNLKWVLISISPIKNECGEITNFVAISEDIGPQKQMESELRGAKQQLEHVNEALEREVEERTAELRLSNMLLKSQISERKRAEEEKEQKEKLLAQQSKLASLGEMINMIAHQWRQPLTAISTAAINIKTKKELEILDETALDSILDSILSHTQKMSSTINDFLNFFKPSRQKEHFCISVALKESLNLIGAQLCGRGIKVDQADPCIINVFGFKNELEQVFINVLSNARDAFETIRSAEKKISISCFSNDDMLGIEFCDNAGGIDEQIFDRLFEPYFTTKEPGKGTGIGLYMSKTILQKSFSGDMKLENIYQNDLRIGLRCTVFINQKES